MDKIELYLKESVDLVESVLQKMRSTLEAGEDIKFSCFGKFEMKKMADRSGRNSQTGDQISVTSRRVVTFKPSLALNMDISTIKYLYR
jgi:integration host factor subunit alpha